MVSMNEFYFEETKRFGALGRAGVIHTPHGEVKTPAFMAVGTKGKVKYLSFDDLRETGAQAMLSNGFHLRRKSLEIAKAGGLAEWTGAKSGLERADIDGDGVLDRVEAWHGPTLTDSGGFQVMSLGSGLGKVVSMKEATLADSSSSIDALLARRTKSTPRSAAPISSNSLATEASLVKISDRGVEFTDPFDGEPDFIGPEESMQIQCRIGADIHMAFDELTSLADDYGYNVQALKRTEAWAERSLREHLKLRDSLGYRQSLYGVLQGGRWEDLRRSTARTLAKMEVDGVQFDGFGLGGAFLKEDLGEILRWCDEELPADKPRHLLGLSHPDDIFVGVENGADTFDCVAPMREARHGKIYTRGGEINLRKYAGVEEPLDFDCDCATCRAGYTKGGLRALWKSGDPMKKREYWRLASIHNLRFIVRLTEEIRQSILDDNFEKYRQEFLARYYH